MLLCLACLTMLNKILNAKYDTPKFIRGENVLKKKKLFLHCLPSQPKDVGGKPSSYHMCTILTLNTKYLTILKGNIK